VLDEGLVGHGTVSDEDGRAGTDVECDHRAMLLEEVMEDLLEFAGGASEPEKVAEEGNRRRAWRELSFLLEEQVE